MGYTRCPHPPTAARMAARIQWLRAEEDSTGGVCTCAITGVPVGIGEPCFDKIFRVSTFGESHGVGVGCIVDGVPANLSLTEKDVQPQLTRRRPGQSSLVTPRNEADTVTILSGTENGKTLGTPIAMMVRNQDQRKFDYATTDVAPRPGHADYTYQMKYGTRASSGGGRASARETIARVAAGALAEKWLFEEYGTKVVCWVSSVMDIDLPA